MESTCTCGSRNDLGAALLEGRQATETACLVRYWLFLCLVLVGSSVGVEPVEPWELRPFVWFLGLFDGMH
jgi:hypothetical protein